MNYCITENTHLLSPFVFVTGSYTNVSFSIPAEIPAPKKETLEVWWLIQNLKKKQNTKFIGMFAPSFVIMT